MANYLNDPRIAQCLGVLLGIGGAEEEEPEAKRPAPAKPVRAVRPCSSHMLFMAQSALYLSTLTRLRSQSHAHSPPTPTSALTHGPTPTSAPTPTHFHALLQAPEPVPVPEPEVLSPEEQEKKAKLDEVHYSPDVFEYGKCCCHCRLAATATAIKRE
jgi:hypothetical protein